jgi:uncharacterized protein
MVLDTIKKFIRPSEIVHSLDGVDLSQLEKNGIKVLLIDINNTILPSKSFAVSFPVINWLNEAKERGFRVYLLTNFLNKRIKHITAQLEIEVLVLGFKPSLLFMEEFLSKRIGAEFSQVALIGDQLSVDIITGNMLNLYTILVEQSYSQSGQSKSISFLKNVYLKILNEEIHSD